MATQGTDVARADAGKALGTALKKAERTLETFLGSPEMAQRALRVAFVLVRRTPDLQKCSAESIVNGMLQSAQLRLELGSEAHLVPYKGEAVFIPDWKGLVRLAIRAGSLTSGHGDVVYEGDEYLYRRTADGVEFVHERQRFGARAKQDTVEAHRKAGAQGVYFIGHTPDGPPVVAEMTVDEVEYVRKTYSRSPDGKMWGQRWSAGAIKTVTKQGMKLVPMTPQLQQAIELDNRHETGFKSAVLDEDMVEVQPLKEPRPLKPAAAAEPASEDDVRDEDAKLAKEE